jgi:hypothetical protein
LEDVLHQRPDSEPPMPTMPSAQQQQQMKREPTSTAATGANVNNFEWPRQCSSVGAAEMSGSFSGGTNAIGLNGYFTEAAHQQQHLQQHFGAESPYFSTSSSQSPPMAFHHQSQHMQTFGHNFMHSQNVFAPFEFI